MAVQDITYTNKVDLNDTEVADINKVKASDMNEIKSVVNNNGSELSNLQGKIIWTNPDGTLSFPAQTITLDESLDNYDSYAIIFKQSITGNRFYNTGQIPVGHGTICFYNAGGHYWYRATSDSVSGNIIDFESAEVVPIYQGSETVDNSRAIPMYVIGYKTGLFE